MRDGCPNDCNSNGICMSDSTCKCTYFWSGDSCSIKRTCEEDDQLICNELNSDDIIRLSEGMMEI